MNNDARKLADMVHDAVDRGATTAEEIHKSIADLPLEVLEEVEPLKRLVKRVRKAQERSISAVYELVRGINEEVARVTRDVLPNGRGARQGGRSRTTTQQKSRTKTRRKKAA